VIDEIKDDTETRMEKSVAALETAFARIRTGRAAVDRAEVRMSD